MATHRDDKSMQYNSWCIDASLIYEKHVIFTRQNYNASVKVMSYVMMIIFSQSAQFCPFNFMTHVAKNPHCVLHYSNGTKLC